jgi:hypothetical protein
MYSNTDVVIHLLSFLIFVKAHFFPENVTHCVCMYCKVCFNSK